MTFAMQADGGVCVSARRLGLALLMAVAFPAQAGLSISEALQRASERDPAYAAAFAQQRINREAGEQERASLRPSVSVGGSASYVASDSRFAFGEEKDEYPVWAATLEARQPLLRMDWSARSARAKANDALADLHFRQSQIDFIARVAERYLESLRAQDQLLLTQAEVTAVEKSLEDVRKRYDVELVPGTDLKEAQARFDLAKADVIRAEAQLEQSFDALAEVTGPFERPLPSLKRRLTPPPMPASTADEWLLILKDNSPALQMAELNLKVAEADRQARKAEAQPSADLVASAGVNDASRSELGSRQNEARIGVEVNIPIYAGGLNHSRVREAQARLDALTLERERLLRESERGIRTQYRNYEVSRITVGALEVALDSVRAAQQAVIAGYDAGTRTIADVLDARRRVAQAERDFNQVRYELLMNLLFLQASAGTLGIDDVVVVDALLEMP